MNLLFAQYFKPKYKLLDWIDKEKLEWNTLSLNPNAIEMFEGNEEKLIWHRVVKLENAISFIKKNLNRLDDLAWLKLNTNSNAINILLSNKNKINISKLCKNKSKDAIIILEEYINKFGQYDEKINIFSLYKNPSAVDILNKYYVNKNNHSHFIERSYSALMLYNPNFMQIDILSNDINYILKHNTIIGLIENQNEELKPLLIQYIDYAIDQKLYASMSKSICICEIYIDKLHIFDNNGYLIDPSKTFMIDWRYISKNPYAIKIIEKNLDKINWTYVSQNPSAIHILKANKNKINWCFFSLNPSIFEKTWHHIDINIIDKILAI